ncbi:MAG: sugar transferase [Bacteroidales bacterium]|nr:sugar transferase [Bacteroidales bacterium]
MSKKRQIAKYVVADVVGTALAWAVFFFFRKTVVENVPCSELDTVLDDGNLWLGLLLMPLSWIALYAIQGTYRNVFRKSRLNELKQTLFATLIGSVVIFFVLLLDDRITSYKYYYLLFLVLFVLQFCFTYFPRLVITTRTVRRIHSRKLGFNTLLIGNGSKAWGIFQEVENQEISAGNFFKGYIAMNETADPRLTAALPCLGTMDRVGRIIDDNGIEEVIIAVEKCERQNVSTIINLLSAKKVIIKITPDIRDIIFGSVKITSIFHSPLIVIETRLMKEWQYSVKRIMDVVISLMAMTVLSPVYLVTAIVVKSTSKGRVFYSQERVGLHGKPFVMHKFRSMYTDAEQAGPMLSSDNDPRITPFGRFMRKVRLDEIPQFYNVLKGTMSLVGPRPERQYYIDQIVSRAPEYMLLQKVKPGITSWGQVKYGYAENVDQMVERMRYDLLYLENMSLTTDIKILLYTAIIIVQGRGK